jgi:hypothetical protein
VIKEITRQGPLFRSPLIPAIFYALCNDGEIFRLVNRVWQPMPPIPQDDPRGTGVKPKLGFIPIADEPGG